VNDDVTSGVDRVEGNVFTVDSVDNADKTLPTRSYVGVAPGPTGDNDVFRKLLPTDEFRGGNARLASCGDEGLTTAPSS
jgi:hypothetical protein